MRRWRVALAGYYGFGNLGDELLLRASLEALARCDVERDAVVVLSADPSGTERDFGVAAVSRWSLRAVRGALSSSETLLLGGGGLFQDATSLRSCLWYWGLVRLARLCGARPWALGQSIGPLNRPLARRLTRDALGSCSVLQLRDVPSMEWAARLGLSAVRGEDLALTLNVNADTHADGGKIFLLNLRPHKDASRFVDLIAPRVSDFEGETVGAALSEEDVILLEEVRGRLRLSRVVLVKNLEEAEGLWGRASWALGMRLHFAVLSALCGTPLAVLSYDPKTAAFAERIEVPCLAEHWEEPRPPRLSFPPETLRGDVDLLCRAALGGRMSS